MSIKTISRGLIVSCQTRADNPLHGSRFMSAMARAAEQGGAIAIRANGTDDVRAIKQAVRLPVIGMYKQKIEGYEAYITPTVTLARVIAKTGADIIALDATRQSRPDGAAPEFIARVKRELGLPVLADVSTIDEGILAAEAGADYIATTMSGVTPYSPQQSSPDFETVRELCQSISTPVIAQGRFWLYEEVQYALSLGAHAVVVGTAITNPKEITKRLVSAFQ